MCIFVICECRYITQNPSKYSSAVVLVLPAFQIYQKDFYLFYDESELYNRKKVLVYFETLFTKIGKPPTTNQTHK